jgi:hypothetical protein
MATVELAASLPVLMLLVLAGLFGVRVADAHARCADAAREVARAAARGDLRAIGLGRRAMGGAGDVSIRLGTDTVTAIVSVRVRPYGVDLAQITVVERATAALEPEARAVPP